MAHLWLLVFARNETTVVMKGGGTVGGRRGGAGMRNGGVRCDCFRGEIKRTLRRPSQEHINKSFSQTSQERSTKPALPQSKIIKPFRFRQNG